MSRRQGTSAAESIPAFSQMVVGMPRKAVAKASMARLRLPGVLAACAGPQAQADKRPG